MLLLLGGVFFFFAGVKKADPRGVKVDNPKPIPGMLRLSGYIQVRRRMGPLWALLPQTVHLKLQERPKWT